RHYRPENRWRLTRWECQEFLGLSGGPRDARPLPRRPVDLLVKRIVDIAGALLGLAVLSPLLLAVTALLLAVQGRPIFFRQRRPGLKGRIFGIVKFRTMRPGSGPDEERTTWIGRLLRST